VGSNGGFVVSFDSTNNKGTNTGDNVWFTGDYDSADQVLACAIQAGLVDTSRIYTAGYSAGGLQACGMVSTRGKYLAAAICYSGGAAVISGVPQDKTDLPAVLLLHGAAGKDTFILDFNQASHTWETSYVQAGGFAIDCDDGGDHITSAATRLGFGGRAMPFFQAHTYNNRPEPYNPLPSSWPSYCQIAK
jgi:poly(3-hydroxybutyrate) depolymerase